jgi:5-methylcytosine-specific restriction endonuclease McrA
VVARHTPFTIRLKDRLVENSVVAGVAARIDPGSKATGISVTDEVPRSDADDVGQVDGARQGLYALELRHRGAVIRKNLEQRAAVRRRSADVRYRAPRFDNRRRKLGWLPPSLQHRVDTVFSQVRRLAWWAPVTEVHVERVAFDAHAISVGCELTGVEYQQGTLAGYEVRQYLLEKWGRACAYCGRDGVPLQVEHIVPRASGGSGRISNLTLACGPCNQAKAPLRDAATMNATRYRLAARLSDLGLPVSCWSGGRTKCNRAMFGLAKSHTLDALAVGEIESGCRIVRYPSYILVVAATGRGVYARTRTDAYSFPRLALPRTKTHHGFRAGDLVQAVVPVGKKTGTYTGRVAVRANGRFNIRTRSGLVQGVGRQHVCLLQRADGYGYTTRTEVHVTHD